MGPQSFEQRTREGRTFSCSSGKLAFALAGNFRATIQNPNGSGKKVWIYALVGTNDASGVAYGNLFLNPDTNLPSTVKTGANQNLASSNQPVAIIKADTGNPLSGGTTLFPVDLPANGRTVMKEELMVLSENQTLGMNFPFLLGANANLRVYWWEEG